MRSMKIRQGGVGSYRVGYRVSGVTSQEQLDRYLCRRCAEFTLYAGYDFFTSRSGPAY